MRRRWPSLTLFLIMRELTSPHAEETGTPREDETLPAPRTEVFGTIREPLENRINVECLEHA